MTASTTSVDVARLRANHPIEDVIGAAGIELAPRGRGFMGCCPFHDDSTASLSVGGVPNRFHCFGCGASGDVIDFVRRLRHLSFRDAVRELEGPAHAHPPLQRRRSGAVGADSSARPTTALNRAYEINSLAWQHFSAPVATQFADHYLHHHRGIELTALRAEFSDAPLAGSVGHAWTGLVDHLRRHNVTDEEILAMDLARRTSRGNLIDTLRDRIVIPVTDPNRKVAGFIGRDISGDPRAPKYRNPTRTATFEKSLVLYRPTHHRVDSDGTVVVVEGTLDALAIAAAAARTGATTRLAPCTTNGVTVSAAQAAALARHPGRIVIALDSDEAGGEGTLRWVEALTFGHNRIPDITRLPTGTDPADWLARAGDAGLDAFYRDSTRTRGVAAHLPGRELVQLSLARARDPIQDTIGAILPLTAHLSPSTASALLKQAEDEMTRSGWNPRGAFSRPMREEALRALHSRLHQGRQNHALPQAALQPFTRPSPTRP